MSFSQKIVNLICLVLLLAAAFGVWQINGNTYLCADDYLYSFRFNPGFAGENHAALQYERIQSIPDYIASLKDLYLTLTGRIVPHAILQFFLLLPAWIFDLFNTLAFLALSYLYGTWIAGRRHDLRIVLTLVSAMVFYLIVAVSRRNFYYPAFSCNYLWTQLIVFVFLIPVRRLIQEQRAGSGIPVAILMFIAGLVAGDTNEPVIPALLLAMGVYLLIRLVISRRGLPLWYYTGMMGLLLGFMFLYFAPGNSGRAAYEAERVGSGTIGFSLVNLRPIARANLISIPLVLLGIWGIFGLSKRRLRQNWQSYLFVFLLFSGSIFAILFAPIYANRMTLLFGGFLMLFCLQLFMAKWGQKPAVLILLILVLLPAFGLRLYADFKWSQSSEKEYELFLNQVDDCPSDSCLVSPRGYHESLTGENWAKPVATYYGKNYIGVMDEYAPELLENWKEPDYKLLYPPGREVPVQIHGLRYVDHNPYCRSLYVLLKSEDMELEGLRVTLKSADLPDWLEEVVHSVPQQFIYYLLPAVIDPRPQVAHRMGDMVVYVLPMPIEDGKEDLLSIQVIKDKQSISRIFLQDVLFH
ncbi:MAG: DUF6056 family protein [Candidatus Cloacimonetes bacterium]|nr:DUF6056 family protein [Candidatus Cloacimonadota bacterium]